MESIIIISNYFYRIHNRFFFTLGISIAAGDLCCSALFSIEIHFMTGFFQFAKSTISGLLIFHFNCFSLIESPFFTSKSKSSQTSSYLTEAPDFRRE